jgi:hypothetical protein
MPGGIQASDEPPVLLECYQQCDTVLTTAQNLIQERQLVMELNQGVQQLQQRYERLNASFLKVESQLQAVELLQGRQLSNSKQCRELNREKKRVELMYSSLKLDMQEVEQELERQRHEASGVQQVQHQGPPAEQPSASSPHDLQPWVRAAVAGAEALHLLHTAMEAHEKKDDQSGYPAACSSAIQVSQHGHCLQQCMSTAFCFVSHCHASSYVHERSLALH